MEVKQIIPNLNKPVYYNGTEYTLTGSTVKKDKQGKIFYQAEILDKCGHSVIIARLEEVHIQLDLHTDEMKGADK